MIHRRSFIAGLGAFILGGAGAAKADHEPWFWGGLPGSDYDPYFEEDDLFWPPRHSRRRRQREQRRRQREKSARGRYAGRRTVAFRSAEKPGTILIRTRERALYLVLGKGRAVRYGIAVG